jgi:hypothetical protein
MQDDERFIIHMIEQGVNGYLYPDRKKLKAIYSVIENDYYFSQYCKTLHKTLLNKL